MFKTNINLILLVLSAIINIFLLYIIFKKVGKSQLRVAFSMNLICVLICLIGLISQILLSEPFHIPPIYFDYFVYIGTCILPVSIFLTGKILLHTKIKFSIWDFSLFIIPFISLVILWTNDFHHLFYVQYSISINECIFGAYKPIHDIYSYILLFGGIAYMLNTSFKNSGFFSKQSLLLVLGIIVPVVTNLLGTFQIIPMTIYLTPITFTVTLICIFLSIFKFKLMGVSPIALQTIVDRISDSYIVLNDNYTITDFNKTFLYTFKVSDKELREKNIFAFLNNNDSIDIDVLKLKNYLETVQKNKALITYEQRISTFNKYFTVEINSLYNNENFLGILILFKDITQHKLDMQVIQNNQDMLMEKERLASLGQLIGGISHNLKTPIMSISGAAEGLSDLIREYEASVGNPEVTVEDHHAIASDMKAWIDKIHEYTSYMSDIITAVKGQAVNLSENENDEFSIEELLKRVNILMKHEIRNASLTLTTKNDVPVEKKLHGDVNSLVQVVNNLIANAIQSYNGRKDDVVDLSAYLENSNIVISVSDNGSGMPKDVQEKLFNSMITTKGKNGTGLGMFMSYSTIKGHFKGDIKFKTEINKGTTFYIILPLPENS